MSRTRVVFRVLGPDKGTTVIREPVHCHSSYGFFFVVENRERNLSLTFIGSLVFGPLSLAAHCAWDRLSHSPARESLHLPILHACAKQVTSHLPSHRNVAMLLPDL